MDLPDLVQPGGVGGVILVHVHGLLHDVLVLIPLPGAAKGGVLALKDIQPAHDIAAGADGVGDGKGVV